jgi:hypothetical protein
MGKWLMKLSKYYFLIDKKIFVSSYPILRITQLCLPIKAIPKAEPIINDFNIKIDEYRNYFAKLSLAPNHQYYLKIYFQGLYGRWTESLILSEEMLCMSKIDIISQILEEALAEGEANEEIFYPGRFEAGQAG